MGIAVGNGSSQAHSLPSAGCSIRRRSLVGRRRMQEGILSLMQMPRTTIAVQQVKEAGLPYIVLLADPTTGGVSASFAMLGDIALAEPGTIVGFAGARVIENDPRKASEGFQRAEYLLDHGMIDMVVPRCDLAVTLGRIIDLVLQGTRRHGVSLNQGGDAASSDSNDGQRPHPTDAVLERLAALHPKLIDLGLGRRNAACRPR